MPELPEVRAVVQSLQPLVGKRIFQIETPRADVFRCVAENTGPQSLHGAEIHEIIAHGKQIWLHFDLPLRLMIHLGMSGQVRLLGSNASRAAHTHVVFRMSAAAAATPRPTKPVELRTPYIVRHSPLVLDVAALAGDEIELHFVDPRRFGGLWLLGPNDHVTQGRGRPPGPDAHRMTAEQFRTAIHGTRRQIKALLLDQNRISGLGNIYVDESLHAAKIHPLTRASDLNTRQHTELFRAIKRVLTAAVNAGGSTLRDYRDADGNTGQFQLKHRVYGRAGLPCKRCKTLIKSDTIAGRTTCWCPKCQRKR